MDTLEAFINVQIIQFSLHAKAPFVTITKCVDYIMQVSLFLSVLFNMFHCKSVELNDCLNRDNVWSWSLCLKVIVFRYYKCPLQSE